MPLKKGSSNADIAENMIRLTAEGKPQKQAAAISYSVAGRSKKKPSVKKKKKKAIMPSDSDGDEAY